MTKHGGSGYIPNRHKMNLENEMEKELLRKLEKKDSVIRKLSRAEEVVWINPKKVPYSSVAGTEELTSADIEDASARLRRFAPLLMKIFPETADRGGVIESEISEISEMKKFLESSCGADFKGGRLLLKRDSDLAVAGSVKARGGIYEVLKHSEDLAIEAGILTGYEDDYCKLAEPEARAFFGQRKVQVGSTGNLGMSIGMMSAALGYQAIVHMSADAKQWKKDYLRAHGVTVIEYDGDYGKAVKQGRLESDADPMSYFVDDENSRDLFLGYAVAEERLKKQLKELQLTVDEDHPLFVYIPCGVGGAPGGVTFGLKQIWGDSVHVFFCEPVQACCMLLGLASGLHSGISVQDIGLTGKTHADGLAVGRPSGFVGGVIEPLISGEVTVEDGKLYDYMRALWDNEGIFIEPSSCAAFHGTAAMGNAEEIDAYIRQNDLEEKMKDASHIVWATGGKLVPESVREKFMHTYLK